MARAEISFPLTLPQTLGLGAAFGGAAAPYVFGAIGIASLEEPTAVEAGITRASSFGAGIRLGLSEKASPRSASLTFEYAHGSATDMDSEDRFSMRLAGSF